MYQVIISINNNEEVIVLPAVPPDLGPQILQNNGTYEGLSRDYNTLGTMGLWEMTISSFFPVGKRYSFMPADNTIGENIDCLDGSEGQSDSDKASDQNRNHTKHRRFL